MENLANDKFDNGNLNKWRILQMANFANGGLGKWRIWQLPNATGEFRICQILQEANLAAGELSN